jgi:hypothetical protein
MTEDARRWLWAEKTLRRILGGTADAAIRFYDWCLDALRGCNIQNPDCDEDTAGLLIGLHEQGHHEVLHALMVAGRQSDGALSEMLGPFYGDVLAKAPSTFVAALRRVDAPTQKAVCALAGGGDGGGIAPSDLIAARQHFTRAGGDVALRCLREIENINREIDSAGKH